MARVFGRGDAKSLGLPGRNALELGLTGTAENLIDGRVKVIAEGNMGKCLTLLKRIESPETPGQVIQVTHRWDPARGGYAGFAER